LELLVSVALPVAHPPIDATDAEERHCIERFTSQRGDAVRVAVRTEECRWGRNRDANEVNHDEEDDVAEHEHEAGDVDAREALVVGKVFILFGTDGHL
jgi:hypothetical protein